MPYVLAPLVSKKMSGLWQEGSPYASEVIYDICSGTPNLPPVHYESHTLKPHSICHFDAPGHIIQGGKTIDQILKDHPSYFYGQVDVVRLAAPNFQPHLKAQNIQHWEISLSELKIAFERLRLKNTTKLFLTFEGAPGAFYADSSRALTLSRDATEWLLALPGFNLFGTVWKSTDFQPQSRERPIHKLLFAKAGIIECLNLDGVPEGNYFLSAFPIPLEGATESPVCPVLFSKNEIEFK